MSPSLEDSEKSAEHRGLVMDCQYEARDHLRDMRISCCSSLRRSGYAACQRSFVWL